MRNQIIGIAATAIVGLGASCQSQTSPAGDVFVSSAVMFGRVATANGAPIAGAVLHGSVYNNCTAKTTANLVGSGRDNIVTAADGTYRDVVHGIDTTSYCIVVSVNAIPAMGLPATTTPGTMLPFRGVNGAPRDSVRIDVTIR